MSNILARGFGRHRWLPPAVVMGALVAALVMSLSLSTAVSHAQTSSNLTASASSDFGCGKRMVSNATYFPATHRAIGRSTLYNNCQLLGFKAAVLPLLSDADGNVVGYGMPQRYGVDARGPCVFSCPPTVVRPVTWSTAFQTGTDEAATELLDTATELTLVQYPAPNNWIEAMQSLGRHLDEAVRVARKVGELIAIIVGGQPH